MFNFYGYKNKNLFQIFKNKFDYIFYFIFTVFFFNFENNLSQNKNNSL